MRWLALLALVACSTTEDRPATLAYITESILAPNCTDAECHSSVRHASGYMFDTVAHAQDSITNGGLITVCSVPPCFPGDSYLITVLTDKDSLGNRMPLDQPLDNKDIFFIGKWIEAGAPGYVAPP